ncbi:MAG: VOC family protein [Chloroflexi bacterium]|nr:VOC family protein [Chloroflexota bacterium]
MKLEPGEINIICSDVHRSLHFYGDTLGFLPTLDAEGFYHLRAGAAQYLLLPTARRRPPPGSTPEFSMDLVVDNLREAYAYFQAHGVVFAQDWRDGAAMFAIRDPDGLPWEIIQRRNGAI